MPRGRPMPQDASGSAAGRFGAPRRHRTASSRFRTRSTSGHRPPRAGRGIRPRGMRAGRPSPSGRHCAPAGRAARPRPLALGTDLRPLATGLHSRAAPISWKGSRPLLSHVLRHRHGTRRRVGRPWPVPRPGRAGGRTGARLDTAGPGRAAPCLGALGADRPRDLNVHPPAHADPNRL